MKKAKAPVSKIDSKTAKAVSDAADTETSAAQAGSAQEPATISEQPAEADELEIQLSDARTTLLRCLEDKSAIEAELATTKANLAEVSARLELAIEERMKLDDKLAAALEARAALVPDAKPVAVLSGPSITVRTRDGRKELRYRAGRAFAPESVTIAVADLSPEQVVAIQDDPELHVTVNEIPD